MSAEPTITSAVEVLLAPLPDACKDLRLNLTGMLRGGSVDQSTTYCSALAAAYFVGAQELAQALRADSASLLTDDEASDAQAAASLMGMTTVYYKSRDLLGKPTYEQMRPSLRMNRMMSPASRVKYEAAAMTCAAIAACPACLKAHEKKLIEYEWSEGQIHELLRIAAIVHGTGIALGSIR
ncbi:MAG: carboxymuconolactone decarboxylase family protein [Planctomycetia bacterium]|nr:carboxymuconolactone decarboxylase family protein [Planctomycetia bacterium]